MAMVIDTDDVTQPQKKSALCGQRQWIVLWQVTTLTEKCPIYLQTEESGTKHVGHDMPSVHAYDTI